MRRTIGISARRSSSVTDGMWWRVCSSMSLLGGLWMVVSRAAIATSIGTTVQWNGVVAGSAVASVATIRLVNWRVGSPLSLANVALGAWMVMSPLVYGYPLWVDSRLAWNDLITGIVITACALASFAIGAQDE